MPKIRKREEYQAWRKAAEKMTRAFDHVLKMTSHFRDDFVINEMERNDLTALQDEERKAWEAWYGPKLPTNVRTLRAEPNNDAP